MDHLDSLILFGLILNLCTGSPRSEGVMRKPGHDQQVFAVRLEKLTCTYEGISDSAAHNSWIRHKL